MAYSNTSDENKLVLKKASIWFSDKIVKAHIKNIEKLKNPSEFKINPFTAPYLSACLTGDVTSEGIAKALVYPRILGTSLATSLGSEMQSFISDVLGTAFGSTTTGIDIEFTDQVDGRKKYAQLKLGPNTINKDDVKTLVDHFKGIKGLAKQNGLPIQLNDLVVCILYGDSNEISGHYRNLQNEHNYPVLVAEAFWHRLTGDEEFYNKLIHSITKSLVNVDNSTLIANTISELAKSQKIQDIVNIATRGNLNSN